METNINRKGISLIVLVLTIIVMIILATAIILSISNSGIMNKANEAKNDNDAANIKEYVNILQAEWDLMDTNERNATGKSSKIVYVNAKLEEKGYTGALLMEDGTLYTNLQANAKVALEDGIKIGDVVEGYSIDKSKSIYKTSGKENTAPNNVELSKGVIQEVSQIEYEDWRFIGIGNNGEVLIAPDMVKTTLEDKQRITLSGKGGFVYGPDELDDMCEELYSTDKGKARSMNIEDVFRVLDYTGTKARYYDKNDNPVDTLEAKMIKDIATLENKATPDETTIENYYSNYCSIPKESSEILKKVVDTTRKTTLIDFVYTNNGYWLASPCVAAYLSKSRAVYYISYVYSTEVRARRVFYSDSISRYDAFFVRPTVSLNSDVQLQRTTDGWEI